MESSETNSAILKKGCRSERGNKPEKSGDPSESFSNFLASVVERKKAEIRNSKSKPSEEGGERSYE